MPSDAALREMATARLHRIFAAMERPEVPRPRVVIPPPSPAEQVASTLRALAGRAGDSHTLYELSRIDPATLPADGLEQIHYLQACDKVARYVSALTHTAVVAITGTQELTSGTFRAAQQVEREIAAARGTGPVATATTVAVARDLATVFTATRAALARGLLTEGHVRVLCERTAIVADPVVRTRIEAVVLPKAGRVTAYAFGKIVDAAVCTHDPDAPARHRKARHGRSVVSYRNPDAMGAMTISDTWTRIHAMTQTITTRARALQLSRGGARAAVTDPDAYLDACRADVLAALVLGTDTITGTEASTSTPTDTNSTGGRTSTNTSSGSEATGSKASTGSSAGVGGAAGPAVPAVPPLIGEPREPVLTGQLVIDLRTLQGLNDDFALLDGSPIPAVVGRDLARGIRRWRRMVTDPVTGHLLDYGRTQYLPEPLLRYVGARDGICRAPYCNALGTRSEVDHATSWAQQGTSDPANTGLLCRCTDHALKTDTGFWSITDGQPDGSATFTTTRGQSFQVPPRPFLHDPADTKAPPGDPPSAEPPDREPKPADSTDPPTAHEPDRPPDNARNAATEDVSEPSGTPEEADDEFPF
jgi:hypothetical protein